MLPHKLLDARRFELLSYTIYHTHHLYMLLHSKFVAHLERGQLTTSPLFSVWRHQLDYQHLTRLKPSGIGPPEGVCSQAIKLRERLSRAHCCARKNRE